MAITGEKITRSLGGGLIAQAFGVMHDGVEQLKKTTGHVGDGHFGWHTRAEHYDGHGYPSGGTVIYCECGDVLVPADGHSDDAAGRV